MVIIKGEYITESVKRMHFLSMKATKQPEFRSHRILNVSLFKMY